MKEVDHFLFLFNEFKKGNKQSFEKIFREFYQDLSNYSYSYVKDFDRAEELVQEMFLKIWENRERINIKSSVKSYLFRAVRNHTLNFLSKKKIIEVDIDDINSTELSEEIIEISEQTEIDLGKVINEAVDKLPPKCRIIFRLSREEGMSHKQIAEDLNVSAKTVENQVGIALRKLREILAPILQKAMLIIPFLYCLFI